MNHSDRQAHSLMDSPVFYTDRVRRFYSWEELIEAPPPELSHYPDKPLCLCEDGSIWPVSNNYMPDIQDRQMQFKDFHQEAEQNAAAGATRTAGTDPDSRAWSVVSMIVFITVSVVLILIALQSQLLADFWPGGPTAALPVMIGLSLLRRSPKSEVVRKPRYRQWEIVRVFDELGGFPWACSMPLEILKRELPQDCRYTQEVGNARWQGVGLFGGGILVAASMLTWGSGAPVGLSIAGAMLISFPAAIFGWKKGYEIFMNPPVWVVRRLYAQIQISEDEYQVDYEAMPVIVPEIHTKLTGMPLAIASDERRAEAEEVARAALGSKNGGTATLTKLNLAVAYTPRVLRAHMLYEFLMGRDVKSKMRGPQSKADRVKHITRSGLAFGALALLAALIFFS